MGERKRIVDCQGLNLFFLCRIASLMVETGVSCCFENCSMCTVGGRFAEFAVLRRIVIAGASSLSPDLRGPFLFRSSTLLLERYLRGLLVRQFSSVSIRLRKLFFLAGNCR